MTKENSDICEIYRIGNLINNKFYIGQTIMGVKARFRGHKCLTADGCIKLFNAMECYGRENFYIEAIVSAVPGLNQIEIDILENMLIDQYDAIKNGYNVRHGGSHGKLSEETKRKISQSRIGKFSGENAGFYNHHHTEENKIILSELTKARVQGENNPFYGKHHTEETKQKLSEIRIESGQSVGENNGMFGREHTAESKNKISQTKTGTMTGEDNHFYGKAHTEKSKNKMSISLKGRDCWNKGVPASEEHKQKMKDAWVIRRAKKELAKQQQQFYASTIYYQLESTEADIENLQINSFKYKEVK